ncbi:HlyD family secretion protein [Mesorhizobium sp. 1B3]|uniref:HlyD family secretion protein n=1 Tax=Mesorhizobium sp. 1B3 TaxID=3243599 RepID=UPI003D970DB4
MSAVEKTNGADPESKTQASPAVTTLQVVQPAPKKKRKAGRMVLMALLPVILAAGGAYVWVTGGRYQETENANLRQAKVSIASEAAGRIIEVKVADNQIVKAGDVLFVVDSEPYRIALAEADASLAAARLQVEQLRAAYSQAVAQERVAAGELDYAKAQYDRATELAGKGISAKSSLDVAQRDLDKAEEEHSAALQGIASARAAMGGDPDMATDKHPTVLSALAARDKAAYELDQTTVRAPANGMVSQASSFKLGQFVATGTPLFSLVETGDTWVEANFKETQLTNMKPGQKAEVVLDTYPGHRFEATVEAIGAGTGAEFSLLPAQNATGNWVKVTQRIPVRLKLDGGAAELALRTGMSATVEVDTGVSRGFANLFSSAIAAE